MKGPPSTSFYCFLLVASVDRLTNERTSVHLFEQPSIRGNIVIPVHDKSRRQRYCLGLLACDTGMNQTGWSSGRLRRRRLVPSVVRTSMPKAVRSKIVGTQAMSLDF